MENTFQSKENLAWFPGKCFPEKFERKTLSGSCEKFRNVMLLLIISILVLKLFIAIYILF
jgi:hypothetical protein